MNGFDKSLRDLTGYRLRRTTSTAMSKMKIVFAEFGLRRTTFSTLALVVNNPGLRQSQLAEALAIERPNLVQIVNELEKAGLVKRNAAADDRRAYALQATPSGCDLFEKSMAAVRAYEQKLIHGLSAEQISTLHQTLKIIYANANDLGASDEF